MRIFIATGIFHPEPGGPATYLYRLLPELVARGHEVRVLTFGEESEGDPPDRPYPYPVTRISRRAPAPVRYARYARAARALEAWAEVTYAHSLFLPLAGSRPRAVKVVGDPAWERSVSRGWVSAREDIDAFQGRRYGPLVDALKWLRASHARRAARLVVPSQYLARMVHGWGAPADRVRVIYNALTPPPALPDPAAARAQLGLPGGPLLLTAARLTAWKGVDMLIEAANALEGARLIVAGDGPELPALRAIAGQCTTFLGNVPRERLALYMRAADYVVLYSGYEGLSHTLLEALQIGTPVIASDKGGNPEVVQHEVNGLLVPWRDPPALAATLRRALNEPGLRARLAAQAIVGLERFSWERLVEQTLAVLDETARR
ncbi:MAG: glycosyltransferase family 4 protein [Anaerolineae bacterium]|nr:glycosyltransferase family 4 protein [Anaerolineae bacterium]